MARAPCVDGAATRSCITSLGSVAGKAITTIEGVGKTPTGAAVQQAWLAGQVPQCGYCQSTRIMSASAVLAKNPIRRSRVETSLRVRSENPKVDDLDRTGHRDRRKWPFKSRRRRLNLLTG